MNTKQLTLSAILLAIGALLHTIVPGFILGMKPDFLLSMMFISMLIFPNKNNYIATSVSCGLISALTTQFPGGQLPNIVDKLITGLIVGFLIFLLSKSSINNVIKSIIVGTIGTLISGTTFLLVASALVGLPGGASFIALFIGAVVPAILFNGCCVPLFYILVKRIAISTPQFKSLL